jgi:outer membrane biosynthesis protein TonB
MRRHLLLYRALKRRHRMARPRFSLRILWYGGATFSMFLFILMLLSSGLMYYYFQKCKFQERELVRWRTGVKVREEANAASDEQRGPISQAVRTMQQKVADLPAAVNSGLGYEMPKPSAAEQEPPSPPAMREVRPTEPPPGWEAESNDVEPAPPADVPERRSKVKPEPELDEPAAAVAERPEPKSTRSPAGKTAVAERNEPERRTARVVSEQTVRSANRTTAEASAPRKTPAPASREAVRSGATTARRIVEEECDDPIGSLLSSR